MAIKNHMIIKAIIMVDIDNWNAWTSFMISNGQPSIPKEMDKNLNNLRKWLLSRI